jgi:hypothetical protein
MLNETCCFELRLNGPILDDIIKLAEAIRRLDDVGLREAASTRTLVSDRKSCAGSTVAACQYRSNCDPLCPAES